MVFFDGAPDLVAGILSPETAHRGLTTKKRIYEAHGVKEYWIVDPESQTVEAFKRDTDRYMQHARAVNKQQGNCHVGAA